MVIRLASSAAFAALRGKFFDAVASTWPILPWIIAHHYHHNLPKQAWPAMSSLLGAFTLSNP